MSSASRARARPRPCASPELSRFGSRCCSEYEYSEDDAKSGSKSEYYEYGSYGSKPTGEYYTSAPSGAPAAAGDDEYEYEYEDYSNKYSYDKKAAPAPAAPAS